MFEISDKCINFILKAMKNWKIELSVVLYTHDKRRITTLIYKNISFTLLLSKGVKDSVMYERDRWRQGDKDRLLY